jgi:TnpA family transposase
MPLPASAIAVAARARARARRSCSASKTTAGRKVDGELRREITVYTHISDQFGAFSTWAISCAARGA